MMNREVFSKSYEPTARQQRVVVDRERDMFERRVSAVTGSDMMDPMMTEVTKMAASASASAQAGWRSVVPKGEVCDESMEGSAKRKRKSVYRGIYHHRPGKWGAKIREKGASIWLGSFKSPEEAARAYDEAARRYRGNKAKVNFPQETSPPEKTQANHQCVLKISGNDNEMVKVTGIKSQPFATASAQNERSIYPQSKIPMEPKGRDIIDRWESVSVNGGKWPGEVRHDKGLTWIENSNIAEEAEEAYNAQVRMVRGKGAKMSFPDETSIAKPSPNIGVELLTPFFDDKPWAPYVGAGTSYQAHQQSNTFFGGEYEALPASNTVTETGEAAAIQEGVQPKNLEFHDELPEFDLSIFDGVFLGDESNNFFQAEGSAYNEINLWKSATL